MTSDAEIVVSIRGEVGGGKVVKRTLDDIEKSGQKAKKSVKDLENAVQKTDSSVKKLNDNIKKTESSFVKLSRTTKVIAGSLTSVAGLYALIGLSNEKARKAAKGIVSEFARLIKDIDTLIGAGENLKIVFDKIKNAITSIRAGIRTIPSLFTEIKLAGKLAFIEIAEVAEDFLNDFSKAVETATGGLRKARTFDLTSGLGFSPDALQGLKSYEQNLKDILKENAALELAEAENGKTRTGRNAALSAALREQNELFRMQQEAVRQISKALADERNEIKKLKTEAADMFADFILGTREWKDIAISAISDIARNLLRLSFGGTASGGLGGTLASGIFSIFSGALGGSSGVPIPGHKPPLPGLAFGGSMILGGNSGIDQNVVSLNNQPIVNTSRGETLSISSNSKGSGDGVTVNQTINLSMGVAEAVAAQFSSYLPEIQRATQTALQEAQLRGIQAI